MQLLENPLYIGFLVEGIIFFVLGRHLQNHPPKNVNEVYGYRTSNSVRSQEAWDFSQVYAGQSLKKLGVIFILLCLPGVLIKHFFNWSMPVLIIIFVVVTLLMIALLILKIERSLKRKFDTKLKSKSS